MTIIIDIIFFKGGVNTMILAYILSALGLMKMFEKAGVSSGLAWVPIYRFYLLVKISSSKIWPFIVYICGFVSYIVFYAYSIYYSYSTSVSGLIDESLLVGMSIKVLIFFVIYGLLHLTFNIIIAVKLSRAYTIGGGIAFLIAIIPWAGYMVVGFGQAQYNGPQ